ncbi:peptidase [Rothia mucilaginosa]|uniref:peptidase n=1 Tax=Rothia mucilaginosa TaxID=43675 RepID=UPI0027B9FAA2|nr:peptidase [Rothia mucilaginosa]
MRSKEAHVLESIANPALPTLQIVEYRGETTESAPSVTSAPSTHPVHSGRYTLRTISQPTPPAPSAHLAPAAPTLRAAANGYGFEENTDASAQRHAQTPRVAAALRNAPGLAKLHAVTSEEHDSKLCLWYEPLDAGTLDKLLRARTLNSSELMTLARTLHRALGSLKKVGEGRAELSAEYIALSAAGVPKLLLPDAVYHEAAPQDTEQLTAARGNYARSAAALLWQAACGHKPEPSAARVPLSLRMVSLRMGATGTATATDGAPSSEWIERLGRALEYLLDAPAQEAALAGLSSVVALAEEVPPRPLNVYLSCSERARALIPAAVDPVPVQKPSKLQKTQRYLADRLPRMKKLGVKKPAAAVGSMPLSPVASSANPAPKNADAVGTEATGTSRLTALRGAFTRPTARLGLPARLGLAALALGAIALPLGFTLYGQNAPATAQPVSAQSVNAAGEQEPGGTEIPDQSAQGDQILRALIDQRNQERRARGGAELTVDTAEELSRDSENIRVMAVVSAPGYRADKTEQEALKLSEENGVTRQKVIFDLHRGEKGWEIARVEPVPA